jgi:hypothetical protein
MILYAYKKFFLRAQKNRPFLSDFKVLLSAKHALEPKHTRFLVGQASLERC